MSKEVTKKQIGSIVTLLVAGKVPFEDAKEFINKYKNVPSEKRWKQDHSTKEDCYRIHVSYAELPGVAALEKKFMGKGSVSSLFDGRMWSRHKSCAKIDETPGDREFLVAEVPTEFLNKQTDSVRDALAVRLGLGGWRFAIETEAVEFMEARPTPQLKSLICALGSSAFGDDGLQSVAVLLVGNDTRILTGYWLGRELHYFVSLLLVRKASLAL
ncbi:hypothetical protein K8R04_04560 [Candidatus Uhrbacteria bacterium]|nr:hypothetical protein [Candidatus Uhrbacteria bacterium]